MYVPQYLHCEYNSVKRCSPLQLTVGTTAKTPVHIPLVELEPKDAAVYAATMFAEVRPTLRPCDLLLTSRGYDLDRFTSAGEKMSPTSASFPTQALCTQPAAHSDIRFKTQGLRRQRSGQNDREIHSQSAFPASVTTQRQG